MSYFTRLNLPIRGRGDMAPIGPLQLVDGTLNPVDITGWAFRLAVNAEENPVDPTSSNAFILTGTIVSAALGTYQFLPTAPSAALTPPTSGGPHWFEIEAVPPSGLPMTIAKGRYPLVQDFTP